MTRDEAKKQISEKIREEFRGVNSRKFPFLAALSKIDFYYLSSVNIHTHTSHTKLAAATNDIEEKSI